MGKWKTSGGGFLHGQGFEILDYEFETKTWNEGRDKEYTTLTVRIDIKVDGADKPVKQFLRAGFFYPDNQYVSKDGKTLSSDREGYILQGDTEFARFIDSFEEAGGPADAFDATEYKNFEAMIGYRVEGKKVVDREQQIAAGKKALGRKAAGATEEELFEAGKEKGADGKSYNRTNLLVARVLSAPNEKPAKASSKSRKVQEEDEAEEPKKAPKGRPAKEEEEAPETPDFDEAIVEIVEKYGEKGVLQYARINGAVVKYANKKGMSGTERDALRKELLDEENLEAADERGVISYNAKKKTISLP
jgi:hypothetical protein